ncbi:response regulator, partial [bacterium]
MENIPIPGVDPAAPSGAAPAPAPAPKPADAAQGAPKRILLVDGHLEFTRQLKGMFEAAGCKVELRSDAVSGGAGVNTFKPDAAVVDLDLQGGGGKIVYRVLRVNPVSRDIPIVVLAPTGAQHAVHDLPPAALQVQIHHRGVRLERVDA